jgi:predicted enzyme related to lactoylglutathione lyase
MTSPTPGSLAWFEVAADDVDGAEHFYSRLFEWKFVPDPVSAGVGLDYRVTTAPGGDQPMGGIMKAQPQTPGHAVFYVAVADVAATCTSTEELGGSVVVRETNPAAGPAFAHLRDPAGNLFGVFTPPEG